MTDFTTPVSSYTRPFRDRIAIKLAVALSLVLLADWLFYDQRAGISVVIFSIALAGISFAANPVRSSLQRTLLAASIVLAGLAPAVEDFNVISLLLLIFALTSAVAIVAEPIKAGLGERLAAQLDLLLIGPFRLCWDLAAVLNVPALRTGLGVWIVPLILTAAFASLFASANPLIEKWVSLIDWSDAASRVSVARLLFWTVALSVIWPFVYVRRRNRAIAAAELIPQATPRQPGETPGVRIEFLGEASILRSLILFNLLFAVQTGLDAIYLWGGVALPDGLTYAAYAHRGAYPLILTALLAAGFVLAAMRPGGPAEHSPIIRPLVYLWVAQNVMLVVSSILRLDLYVEIYSLTYWRIAAFIWMGLVAAGLVLIVARIALHRSNGWLIRANLITLATVVYVCSFVNFAAVIADYNVTHSREASGKGLWIDLHYVNSLGPQALPAIDKALRLGPRYPYLVSNREQLVERLRREIPSWRAWSLRGWRLQHYIKMKDRESASSAG